MFPERIVAHLRRWYAKEEWDQIQEHASTPPFDSFLRVNNVKNVQQVMQTVQTFLNEQSDRKGWPRIQVDTFLFPDLLRIPMATSRKNVHSSSWEPQTPSQESAVVIVDVACGQAVLRGADIFACGILGASASLQPGKLVSVFVDLDQTCKRGTFQLPKEARTKFVGRGISQVSRLDVFRKSPQDLTGLGILMTEPLYRIPCLSNLLPGQVFLQNFPSFLVTRVLEPMPGETILDMCAAPGGKTLHIASMLQGQGQVVAVERVASKAAKLQALVYETFGYAEKQVQVIHGDASKLAPFEFDRILLDPPCSGVGQRPYLRWPVRLQSDTDLLKHASYQRVLFAHAMKLLKPGGVLVYSTCTLHPGENEEIVAWALEEFSDQLELEDARAVLKRQLQDADPFLPQLETENVFGCHGLQTHEHNLTAEQAKKVVRFNSVSPSTIGFFMARFRRRQSRAGN